ncbi:MAG: HNH endonuclease [Chloroflexota bacterium]|nr:HNH endonuclease [Chloroflexota bacterium]MDE2929836.1 HNH endonuclease [Chloroflexota bacterium]
MNSINKRVLVLNLDYRPLNICNVRRAFVLLLHGKAEVIEQYADDLVSAEDRYTRPSVIKLHYLVKRPPSGPRLVRQEVFRRDSHTCQYCGVQTRELTIDHVLPRHRGGGHTWENLVSACKDCNHRKGGKTAEEARMRLLARPGKPRLNGYLAHLRYLPSKPHETWVPFLFPTGKPT